MRGPTDTFQIAFDTKEMPGKTRALEIKITKRFFALDEVARIDLRDHPFYYELFEYCVNNPPERITINKRKAIK